MLLEGKSQGERGRGQNRRSFIDQVKEKADVASRDGS